MKVRRPGRSFIGRPMKLPAATSDGGPALAPPWRRRRARVGDVRPPAFRPRLHGRVHVARHRHQRRSLGQPVAGRDHPLVEVLELTAHVVLAGQPVQPVVELGVLLAERDAGREDRDVLALDELLDPPVRVVVLAEVGDRLPVPGRSSKSPRSMACLTWRSTQVCCCSMRARAAARSACRERGSSSVGSSLTPPRYRVGLWTTTQTERREGEERAAGAGGGGGGAARCWTQASSRATDGCDGREGRGGTKRGRRESPHITASKTPRRPGEGGGGGDRRLVSEGSSWGHTAMRSGGVEGVELVVEVSSPAGRALGIISSAPAASRAATAQIAHTVR